MLKKYKPYIIQVLIPILVGLLAAFFTRDSMNVYGEVIKPPLAPPPILFPIVWSILYTLMGISAALVYGKSGGVPLIYWLQLFVNFLWPIIFFNSNNGLFFNRFCIWFVVTI
jgi:tryptophan-rich sensory protein